MKDLGSLCLISMAVLLSGCESVGLQEETPKEEKGGLIVTLNEMEPNRPMWRLNVKDENFEFGIDDLGVPSMKVLNQKATMEDLYNFAQATCYNGRLRGKIMSGKALSIDEVCLLAYVLDAEMAMVQTLSYSLYCDMLDIDVDTASNAPVNLDVEVEEFRRRETNVFLPLMQKYIKGDGATRRYTRKFTTHFSAVDVDAKQAVLQKIYNSGALAEEDRKNVEAYADRHPWVRVTTYILGGIPLSAAERVIAVSDRNRTLSGIEKSADKVDEVYKQIGNEWHDQRMVLLPYLQEFWRTYGEVGSYVTHQGLTSSMAKKMVSEVHKDATSGVNELLRNFCNQFYDLPFVLLTYRSQAKYRQCKGLFNDDETKMQQVLIQYGESIRGGEIIEHVESPYALDVYATFIEDIKSDLGWTDETFKRIQSITDLKEHAKRTNERDVSTGLPRNAFE